MSHPALSLRQFEVNELVWETADVFTLRLRPKTSEDAFRFLAGQWVYLHLLNEDGSSWARAAFSVLSPPSISDESIELGIKVYGDFTKRASQLIPYDTVALQGPFGVFTMDQGASPLVMLAAGIGVTPLLCMTQDLLERDTGRPITFFYSNKTVEDIAYFERLQDLQKHYPQLEVVETLTQKIYDGWAGETGRVNGEMLKKYLKDFTAANYYMCGPSGFMETIKLFLEEEGVSIRDHLKQERFD